MISESRRTHDLIDARCDLPQSRSRGTSADEHNGHRDAQHGPPSTFDPPDGPNRLIGWYFAHSV